MENSTPSFQVEASSFEDFIGSKIQEEVVAEPEVKEVVESTTEKVEKPSIDLDTDYSLEPIEEVTDAVSSFLSLYGVDASDIKYVDEDGTEKSTTWSELTPKEQFEYMSSLTESASPDLAEDEIAFLTAVRESNMTPSEYIQALMEQSQSSESFTTGFEEIDQLSDEDTFAIDYRMTVDSDASDEEILEEFEKVKDTKSFTKRMEKVRENLVEQKKIEYQQEVEQKKEEIIDKVIGIDVIVDRMTLNDDRKNYVLNKMLNIDEYGNSEFVNEYFSDPEKLYKLVAIAEFGEEYINQLHELYKAQITKAKQEGIAEALGKLPDKMLVTDDERNDPSNKVIKPAEKKLKTLQDLHSKF